MAAARAAIDLVVWRIPPPPMLRRMADDDLDRLFADRASRRRPRIVLGREVDRRDAIARRARRRREARDRARQKATARRRAERLEYDLWVDAQFRAAEAACRGVLLSRAGIAAGTDTVSLFSGPAARAYKHASEELRNWWLDNPRMTCAEWKAAVREPEFDPTHPDNNWSDDYATAV